MKGKLLQIILILTFVTCKSQNFKNQKSLTRITVDTLLVDKISIRAITLDKNMVYYAADKNRFGKIDLTTKTKFEQKIINDTLKMEFRSIAQTSTDVFILSIGNPAILYKI